MDIALVIGTRPEFIQCTQVVRELNKHHNTQIIHTGQHYDYIMNQIFFDELQIPEPSCHLDIGSGSHGYQTGEMLKKIEVVLSDTHPDMVLVFGDTNSTLAGAISAAKLHIPVGHIEAGMRSFDRTMPEEINRILTDHCSDILFCSTKRPFSNLAHEGLTKNVFLTGDVTVDALRNYRKIARRKSKILQDLSISPKEYMIATIHRASNTDVKTNLKHIIEALIASDKKIVVPLHPRTEAFLKKYNLFDKINNCTNVITIPPLGYLDFLQLLSNAAKVLTDSGGIQKEAFILKVPCITLRDNTEWVETVEEGWNILSGTDKKKITKMILDFSPSGNQCKVFGENASKKITGLINTYQGH